ncbi:hypothetical protein OTU49_010482 [Cherax quadricarinatus]|uniref:Uncharacterized protein n=1 Tax=Cherax quadricarinatus TaxID=27406 RepID=A0AAW0WEC4_CHEQU
MPPLFLLMGGTIPTNLLGCIAENCILTAERRISASGTTGGLVSSVYTSMYTHYYSPKMVRESHLWVYTSMIREACIWVYTSMIREACIWVYTSMIREACIWVYTSMIREACIWVYTGISTDSPVLKPPPSPVAIFQLIRHGWLNRCL